MGHWEWECNGNGKGYEDGKKIGIGTGAYPPKIGNSGVKSISLLATNGSALYPRYVT